MIRSAAEIYDEFFVPALFQEWSPRVANAARVRAGERVLDVACGTGVLARELEDRVGAAGSVVGLDVNEGMLGVARRTSHRTEWVEGRAEALPFEDESFDAVLCQFGLMFFEDRRAAIEQMMRVVRPGGRLAVAVWDSIERTPGYAAVTRLLARLFGERIADALRAPFSLGDLDVVRALFAGAGVREIAIQTFEGTARFPSIRSWMRTDVRGWTLADKLDDAALATLTAEAERELSMFVASDGRVVFATPAHVVTAVKR